MGKAVLILWSDQNRRKAIDWIRRAHKDSRITFEGPQRTLPQSKKFWAMMTEVSQRRDHFGKKYLPETWRTIFMKAWGGREVSFVPSLDGKDVIPVMYSTAELSVEEMCSLIDWVECWAAENDFEFSGPKRLEPPPPATLEDYR